MRKYRVHLVRQVTTNESAEVVVEAEDADAAGEAVMKAWDDDLVDNLEMTDWRENGIVGGLLPDICLVEEIV